MLVFTWDGVGLGPDEALWGGDALLGTPGYWQRVAHFRQFSLPGGERAGREPWRSAAGLCWEAGLECPLEEASDPLLYSFWQQGKNAPRTTAAGRLFDAASALCGVCSTASFEGQGPMQLEALAAGYDAATGAEVTRLELKKTNGIYNADWTTLLSWLLDTSYTKAERAAGFHASMAQSLLEQAQRIRQDTGVEMVGLGGGVFQNRVLTERSIELLSDDGFTVFWPLLMPVNDAAISFGQIVEYAHKRR
jgi:hydrogenase maturation protein HypF